MKAALALVVLLCGCSTSEVERLAAENERLRLFNAREVRRYKKPDAVVNYDACAEARHLMGTPASLVAAVYRQENGPPDIETGVLGKTDWIAANYPIKDWAALETARTMNIYAWHWLTKTPEGRVALKKILAHASKKYTGDTLPQAWVKNVYQFQKDEADKLKE